MAENGKEEKPSVLESKIIRQIEYYFGDINLRKDKFLQEKISEDDGWVALETLTTFNRLRQLSSDHDVIVTALQKSKSGLIEISEDKKKIRRSVSNPLPEDSDELRAEMKSKSVYCKGFPTDANLDTIQEFFDKHGKVSYIQMRKTIDTKEFKGSVFATFEKIEEAKKFVEAESIKCGETELIRLFKGEYFKKKQEERKKAKLEEKLQKQKEKDEKTKQEEEEIEKEYEPGCILFFSGANDQTSREDLQAVFDKHGSIRWIDFTRGETQGYIRFEEGVAKEAAEKVKEANDGKIVVKGEELSVRILEGEEEKKKWHEIREQQMKMRQLKRDARKRKPYKGRQARDFKKKRQFEGKKTVFNSDDDEEDDDNSDEEVESKSDTKAVKRSNEDTSTTDEPVTKQIKTETAAE
ncbi:lupus La protein-like [Ptychodera flava]|uniref:lupus La protein-like n=1 Tax=Ptychodera flava TaxID=63121 RepID=UPI003969D27B